MFSNRGWDIGQNALTAQDETCAPSIAEEKSKHCHAIGGTQDDSSLGTELITNMTVLPRTSVNVMGHAFGESSFLGGEPQHNSPLTVRSL